MILRETPMKELVARRDELQRQVEGINREIARRFQEEDKKHQHEFEVWSRLNPRPMAERLS